MTDCVTGGRVGAWEHTGRGAPELGSGGVDTEGRPQGRTQRRAGGGVAYRPRRSRE